jgi:predicted nucleic acid-binding protein
VTLAGPGAPVVIDASFALEAVLAAGPSAEQLAAWASEGRMRLAPPHFWVEVANVLLRRRGFEPGRAGLVVGALARSGIETADRGIGGLVEALDLAGRHGLSVYDASYLQLAADADAELATFDVALERAARAEGLEVVAP